MTIQRFSMSATPGDVPCELFFSSQAAETKGSHNLAGIANPGVDALIEKIIAADRPRVNSTIACRAFDRVFRAGRYWVPHWNKATTGSPIGTCSAIRRTCRATRAASARRTSWWSDAAKAAKLEQAK